MITLLEPPGQLLALLSLAFCPPSGARSCMCYYPPTATTINTIQQQIVFICPMGIGAASENRTHNLRVTKPVLCLVELWQRVEGIGSDLYPLSVFRGKIR